MNPWEELWLILILWMNMNIIIYFIWNKVYEQYSWAEIFYFYILFSKDRQTGLQDTNTYSNMQNRTKSTYNLKSRTAKTFTNGEKIWWPLFGFWAFFLARNMLEKRFHCSSNTILIFHGFSKFNSTLLYLFLFSGHIHSEILNKT